MDSDPRPTRIGAAAGRSRRARAAFEGAWSNAAMSSSSTKTAQYGSWKSPITSDLIVAQSISLSDVCLDGEDVYWLEGRPQEQGRYVVVRAGSDGQPTDITPLAYNARTRVHEYGGGSWTVHNGTVYFSNFADGRLYSQVPGVREPRALTPEPPGGGRQWRFADGVIDARRSRWIGVREDHTGEGEPVNAIVAVDLGGGSGRGRRWRQSLECRNGCSACRPTLSRGRSGSSAPITKAGSATSPCSIWRMKRSRGSQRRSRSSVRCALWTIARCFAPARPIIPPASWHSISRPVGTRC